VRSNVAGWNDDEANTGTVVSTIRVCAASRLHRRQLLDTSPRNVRRHARRERPGSSGASASFSKLDRPGRRDRTAYDQRRTTAACGGCGRAPRPGPLAHRPGGRRGFQ
jgi:hypothetical protein